MLATSRAPLHVSGEHQYSVDSLVQAEAVTLFADRARSVVSRFRADGAQPLGDRGDLPSSRWTATGDRAGRRTVEGPDARGAPSTTRATRARVGFGRRRCPRSSTHAARDHGLELWPARSHRPASVRAVVRIRRRLQWPGGRGDRPRSERRGVRSTSWRRSASSWITTWCEPSRTRRVKRASASSTPSEHSRSSRFHRRRRSVSGNVTRCTSSRKPGLRWTSGRSGLAGTSDRRPRQLPGRIAVGGCERERRSPRQARGVAVVVLRNPRAPGRSGPMASCRGSGDRVSRAAAAGGTSAVPGAARTRLWRRSSPGGRPLDAGVAPGRGGSRRSHDHHRPLDLVTRRIRSWRPETRRIPYAASRRACPEARPPRACSIPRIDRPLRPFGARPCRDAVPRRRSHPVRTRSRRRHIPDKWPHRDWQRCLGRGRCFGSDPGIVGGGVTSGGTRAGSRWRHRGARRCASPCR